MIISRLKHIFDRYTIHTLLLSQFPLLFLAANNIAYVKWSEFILLLGFCMLGAIFVITALSFTRLHPLKRSLIATTVVLAFFSFGHAVDVLIAYLPNASWEDANRLFFIVFIELMIVGIWIIVRTTLDLGRIHQSLNVMALVLFLLSAGNFIFSIVKMENVSAQLSKGVASSEQSFEKPDIYYLIFDELGRSDYLQDLGVDNSSMLKELEEIGFYVANKSTSNYARTQLSLTSSLNMRYVQDLIQTGRNDENEVKKAITHNEVTSLLKSQGYTIYNASYGSKWTTEIAGVDEYLVRGEDIQSFRRLALFSTMLRAVWSHSSAFITSDVKTQEQYRSAIRNIIEKIPSIASDPRSTFTLAHITIPHFPFVLNADGSDLELTPEIVRINDRFYAGGVIPPEDFAKYYADQSKAVSGIIPQLVQKIIEKSESKPIIVVQSDHGPTVYYSRNNPDVIQYIWDSGVEGEDYGLQVRHGILNAYFFPDQNYAGVWKDITPINSFRIIFSQYLGIPMEKVEEKIYYSGLENAGMNFHDVTGRIRQ